MEEENAQQRGNYIGDGDAAGRSDSNADLR
jgi:hypothetical protein